MHFYWSRIVPVVLAATAVQAFAEPTELATNQWGRYVANEQLTSKSGDSLNTTVGLLVSAQAKPTIGADAVHIQLRVNCGSESVYLVNWKAVLRDGSTVASGGPGADVPDFANVTSMSKKILKAFCG